MFMIEFQMYMYLGCIYFAPAKILNNKLKTLHHCNARRAQNIAQIDTEATIALYQVNFHRQISSVSRESKLNLRLSSLDGTVTKGSRSP